MVNAFVSLILGFCFCLVNLSGQTKSFQILDHLATEHAHRVDHEHEHHHQHEHEEQSESHEHNHEAELSCLTVHMVNLGYQTFDSYHRFSFPFSHSFFPPETNGKFSFSPPVFRPPIAVIS